MSRKKTRWRKIARQAGFITERILPHRATGTGTFRLTELPDHMKDRVAGKVCSRPMSDAKVARLTKWVDGWRKLAERTKK